MSDIGITILNSIIFVIFIGCVGNLILGAFLNAIRESKGKPKKKRTSLIIFDCVMVAVCFAAFSIMRPQYSEPEAERWAVIVNEANNSTGMVRYDAFYGEEETLEACEARLSTMDGWGNITYTKVGCGKNCDIIDGEYAKNCSEIKK